MSLYCGTIYFCHSRTGTDDAFLISVSCLVAIIQRNGSVITGIVRLILDGNKNGQLHYDGEKFANERWFSSVVRLNLKLRLRQNVPQFLLTKPNKAQYVNQWLIDYPCSPRWAETQKTTIKIKPWTAAATAIAAKLAPLLNDKHQQVHCKYPTASDSLLSACENCQKLLRLPVIVLFNSICLEQIPYLPAR